MMQIRELLLALMRGQNSRSGTSSTDPARGKRRDGIWREAEQAMWLNEPAQRRFVEMMSALPAPVSTQLTKMAYMDSIGAFSTPSPDSPDALYRRLKSGFSGAGIAFGRGGQSLEDYVSTVKEYLDRYHVAIDHLGETETYKRDTFDSQIHPDGTP